MKDKDDDGELDELLASLPDPKLSEEEMTTATKSKPPISEPATTPNIPIAESSILLMPTPVPTQEGQENLTLPFIELLRTFPNAAKTIIANHAKDREQVENAIKQIEDQMQDAGKISAAMYETWAKLLSIKAEINANANGVLDSSAKLLAAAKNNNIIINVGGEKSIGGLDLTALLAQPAQGDEMLMRKKQ